ncbi:MAG: lytic transglycosylase domain-containing protein [Gammaproteobacteria bacterium]
MRNSMAFYYCSLTAHSARWRAHALRGLVLAGLCGWQIGGHAELRKAGAPEDAQLLTAEARGFDHGVGASSDYERAADLYCRAARLGYAPAQYYLGWMYVNGRGVSRDSATGGALLALAAKQGHVQAQNVLALVGGVKGKLPECMRDDLEAGGFYLTPERRRITRIVKQWAPKYQVNPLLALAIITAESNFDAAAVSAKNAQGLMQLIPETSARFKVRDAFDPVQNVRGGLAYLRWLLAYYRGNITLVAAAYNAGEKAVDRYRGIPPYAETQTYVQRVMRIVKREQHPYDGRLVRASSALPHPHLIARIDSAAD